jgi:general secretion pathway protein G
VIRKLAKLRREGGFTLIELLIVVAIIGIIAAIAIPSLLNAVQRSRQKRTMADMRSIGTAVESYNVDVQQYPTALTATEPTYIQVVPELDGWNNNFEYTVDASGQGYTLISYGRDGVSNSDCSVPRTQVFDCDICMIVGVFVQAPEGIQTTGGP